ncbi:hypothetical protein [Altererythrobacter aquiaggeris]|uniref:hypothetical protein n=1 Tax=Aestuarierythrobacter aquiaggeris TaxID=1898396 RepID=UPI00301AB375
MTNTETATSMTGEARLKKRRRTVLTWVAFMFAGGVVVGMASGIFQGLIAVGSIPAWTIIPVIIIALGGMIRATNLYFHKVDELDLADNLWASLIGLYFYFAALPVWWIINQVGLAGPPDQWAVYTFTLAFTGAAYLARKLGWR